MAAYVVYAASTYSGLYQALAEFELRVFGSYDSAATFLALLIGLCVPTRFIAPKLWKKRQPRPVQYPIDPERVQRTTRRALLGVGAASLVLGVGSAGLALWRSDRSTNAELDLTRSSVSPPRADRVIVSGRVQPRYAITVEETINGSVTRTLYTPITAPGWEPGEPVQYILREELGQDDPGKGGSQRLSSADLVRFGPVALLSHALPGMVRTGYERHGLRMASRPIVLDQNLSDANETLWIVSAFGVIFALSIWILWAITLRTQRLDAAAVLAEAAALPLPTRVPSSSKASGPPKHWELRLGGELMAELYFASYETPWIDVTVQARPGMQPFWRNSKTRKRGQTTIRRSMPCCARSTAAAGSSCSRMARRPRAPSPWSTSMSGEVP